MDFFNRTRAISVCLLLLGTICFGMSSCSLFESKVRVNVSVAPPPPPPAPPQCEQPYCAVNLDMPRSQITHPKIYVLKGQRRLWLVQDKTLVREFKVGLGPSPKGDKYFRGDGRTPEGEYFICVKNASSKYYKSLGINYPDKGHAESALGSGMISQNDYCSIVQANDACRLPPAGTSLGGAIFIHGGGCQDDWTLGCVAVQNYVMDELFEVVSVGTPVIIMP